MKNKKHKQGETRKANLTMEIRSINGDGIFEGYAATFNDIDSYGSRIMPGAFTKTLQERADKIKILFNHDDDMPIGKPIEMREDNIGLWVRGKLSLGTPKADEAFILMQDGVFDCMSIGFNVPRGKERINDGIREITEVKLFEFSPVTFPANEKATINQVRAVDFGTTVDDENIRRGQWALVYALEETLDDIWWGDMPRTDAVTAIHGAVDDFAAAYKAWLASWIAWTDKNEGTEFRSAAARGDFGLNLATYLSDNSLTIEKLAMQSALTVQEIRSGLKSKVNAETVGKFGFDNALQSSCIASRKEDAKAAANKLNMTLDSEERRKFSALIDSNPAAKTESQNALDGLLSDVRKFNAKTGD